jgi:hypothetical protein
MLQPLSNGTGDGTSTVLMCSSEMDGFSQGVYVVSNLLIHNINRKKIVSF